MCSVTEIIEHLTEGDDLDMKEFGPNIPEFDVAAIGNNKFEVYANEAWLGDVVKHTGTEATFTISTVSRSLPGKERDPLSKSFKTLQDACEYLWFYYKIDAVGESDDFSVKDATPEATPEFQFSTIDYKHPSTLDVFVSGKWIGRVGKVTYEYIDGKRTLVPTAQNNPYYPEMWTANWMPEMTEHPAQDIFKSAQEAAQWLWDHRQYQTLWNENEVVSQVIESDEGVSAPSPVKLAATELMDAGFNVTKAEEQENGWLLECNWLAPSNKTFIVGAQRIKEVVGKHLKESVASTRRNGQKMEIRLCHTSPKEN